MVKLAYIRESGLIPTAFCNHCNYYRDLGSKDLDHHSEEAPLKYIETQIKCDRCNQTGTTINLAPYPSANPYPGRVWWKKTPWVQAKLEEFEPGSKAYRMQKQLLMENETL